MQKYPVEYLQSREFYANKQGSGWLNSLETKCVDKARIFS
jgi:hypothetical protein